VDLGWVEGGRKEGEDMLLWVLVVSGEAEGGRRKAGGLGVEGRMVQRGEAWTGGGWMNGRP